MTKPRSDFSPQLPRRERGPKQKKVHPDTSWEQFEEKKREGGQNEFFKGRKKGKKLVWVAGGSINVGRH